MLKPATSTLYTLHVVLNSNPALVCQVVQTFKENMYTQLATFIQSGTDQY